MIQWKVLFFVLSLAFGQVLFAAPIEYVPENPKIEFVAIGKPAMLKIKGHSEDLKAKITVDVKLLTANLIINLKTLVTGIDTRDNHMKDKYLEIAKFPTAELNIKDLQLPNVLEDIKVNQAEQAFKGELQLHGVKKEVEGTYALEVSKGKIKVLAKFSLNLSDFKIDIPSYIGIKVADKVNIESRFDLKK